VNFRTRAASVLAGLSLSTAVMAHAMLDHSAPQVGSSVKASQGRVELWFTEPLEPAFSSVKVLDATGRQVDGRDPKVDSGDPKHLSVSVSALPTGKYRVVWRVISVDTHATAGDFTFDVVP
jgi:methionine-rich copper-binding protein CopC